MWPYDSILLFWNVTDWLPTTPDGLLTVEVKVTFRSLSWIDCDDCSAMLNCYVVISEVFCNCISPMIDVFCAEKLLNAVEVCTLFRARMISICCSELLILLDLFLCKSIFIIWCARYVASTAVRMF